MACIVHRASMCSWFSRPGRLALHARLLSGIPHGRFEAINSSSVPYVAGQFFLHRELGYRGIIGAKLSVRVVEYDTSALPSSILRSEAPPLSATEQSSPPQPGTSSLCQQGVVQDETVSAHVQPHPQSFTPNLSAPTSSTVDDSSCGDVGKKSEERNGKGDPNANLNTREIGGVIDVPSCLYGISEEAWLALNMRPMGGGQRIPHDSVIQHYVPAKVTVEPWYHVFAHDADVVRDERTSVACRGWQSALVQVAKTDFVPHSAIMPFSPTTDGGTTAKTYTSTFDNSFASLLFTDSLSQKPPYVALSRSTLLRWTQAMSAHDVTVYRLRYLDGKFTVTVAPFFASGASSGKFSWNYKVIVQVDPSINVQLVQSALAIISDGQVAEAYTTNGIDDQQPRFDAQSGTHFSYFGVTSSHLPLTVGGFFSFLYTSDHFKGPTGTTLAQGINVPLPTYNLRVPTE
eukprot:m.176339 g.176339  ORF g.176339 m.176339 type:complete len:459 (-) comp14627_c0_seq32:249-1625(-)